MITERHICQFFIKTYFVDAHKNLPGSINENPQNSFYEERSKISLVVGKPVFEVSEQV